jgi:hypothetical protein
MTSPVLRHTAFLTLVLSIGAGRLPSPASAQNTALPRYLRDRENGIPSSLFGTYIRRGELLIFPYFAYSLDNNREYQPKKLGFGLNQDFNARFRSSQGQLFLGYGLTEWLALEVEVAYTSATFEKSPSDPSTTPARIKESGFSDVEGQLRVRVMTESDHRPEIFGFLEMTPSTQQKKILIKEEWDLKPGLGLVRGFSWGTLQLKLTGEYNREGKNPDLGEVAVEYLKRLSPSLRVNLGLEGGEGGAPDEFELISGVHWRLSESLALKLDNSIGLSPKATDWAPQLGVMLSFPR